MTLTWLLVQLVGYSVAFAIVLAAATAAVIAPPYFAARYLLGLLRA